MLLHFVLLLLLPHNNYCTDPPPHTHAFLQTCDTTGLIVHRDGKLDRRNEQSRTQKGQPKAHTKICRYTTYRVSPRVKNSVPRSTYNRNLLVTEKRATFLVRSHVFGSSAATGTSAAADPATEAASTARLWGGCR